MLDCKKVPGTFGTHLPAQTQFRVPRERDPEPRERFSQKPPLDSCKVSTHPPAVSTHPQSPQLGATRPQQQGTEKELQRQHSGAGALRQLRLPGGCPTLAYLVLRGEAVR